MIRLAGCVVTNSAGEIGLLHRYAAGFDWWELPGGKVEAGESDEEAAVRELAEELGIVVTQTEPLGSATFPYAGRDYEYVWFHALDYSGSPTIQEPNLFDDFRYLPIPPDPLVKLSPNVELLLEKLVEK